MDEKIENSLIETVAEPNLEITSDLLELGIEELAQNEVVTKLPVVGSIVAFGKTAVTVRDWIFVKNILAFLRGLNMIDAKKRQQWASKLADDRFRTRVGEEVLSIIDRLKDNSKNLLAGKLFAAYINGHIDYAGFLRICEKLDRLFTSDLHAFKTETEPSEDDRERYHAIGLFSIHYPGVKRPELIAFHSGKELVPNDDCNLLVKIIQQG